jgi:hypothetical protein
MDNLIFIPDEQDLRNNVIRAHHDPIMIRHPGHSKTTELISCNYWWPKMQNDVAKFTRTCILCQQMKVFPAQKPGLLQPNKVPSQAWGNISVDLIVTLPESEGYTSILVVVDCLTKLAHFIPTHDQLGAPGTAQLYKDHVWKHHGIPAKIISDRGTQFVSEFMVELNKMFKISTALSTAYHPETDGQTEQTNLKLKQFLCLFVNFKQNDWADLLAYAKFVYNN